MSSTLSVHLCLGGFIPDFATCSDALGLEPTSTWTKRRDVERLPRDSEPSRVQPLPQHQWRIGFKKREFESVDDAVAAMLQMVRGHEDRILRYSKDNQLHLVVSCTVTVYEDRPIYGLEAPRIRALAKLGAGFDLDIFDYSE